VLSAVLFTIGVVVKRPQRTIILRRSSLTQLNPGAGRLRGNGAVWTARSCDARDFTVAAAEVAGPALLVGIFRTKRTTNVDEVSGTRLNEL